MNDHIFKENQIQFDINGQRLLCVRYYSFILNKMKDKKNKFEFFSASFLFIK